jgi:hypothetical protein
MSFTFVVWKKECRKIDIRVNKNKNLLQACGYYLNEICEDEMFYTVIRPTTSHKRKSRDFLPSCGGIR